MNPVHATTACWPGERHTVTLDRLLAGTYEPALGRLDVAHVQLCPQSHGVVDEALLDRLQQQAPATTFRLHASIRVFTTHKTIDASSSGPEADRYFRRLAQLSREIAAPAYTLHAGERARATPEQLRDNVQRLQDRFGVPVGVEALYPVAGDRWLLSTWAEYEWLLSTDIAYAIDLSHVAIVARRERRQDLALTCALVANPRCIEVHASDNDARSDEHRPLARQPWWWPALAAVNPTAIVFSEGNQKRAQRKELIQ